MTLGKANMDEFAMGSSNENSVHGPVANPWDVERVPGGSSGGSAALVAARLAPAATGTDTGGSIRQPAAFCGLTGIKPTYGRVSRWGMVAFASSLDQAGPLAATAQDCALLLAAMAGHDARDATSSALPVPDYAAAARHGHRAGCGSVCPTSTSATGSTTTSRLGGARARWPSSNGRARRSCRCRSRTRVHGIAAYYVVAPAEGPRATCRASTACASATAPRTPADLTDLYERTRAEGFGPEVRRRILTGAYVLSAGFYDAFYAQAQRVRQLIANDFARAFERRRRDRGPDDAERRVRARIAKGDDPVAMYLNDLYTVSANLVGLPALSVPCGFSHGNARRAAADRPGVRRERGC